MNDDELATAIVEPDYSRQANFIPRDALERLADCAVVGCGAVGRQVALQLAAIGAPRLRLIDPDDIDHCNLCNQGWEFVDVGRPKVAALADSVCRLGTAVSVECEADPWTPDSDELAGAVFCCVDSIDVRRSLFESAQSTCAAFFDARMHGEYIRTFAITAPRFDEFYLSTIFPEAESEGSGCTIPSTIYTANLAAGLLMHQFSRFLRGIIVEPELYLNLPAYELTSKR